MPGKSAIVAAIQLCLGGSAHDTGRGRSVGSLVREGSEGPAILSIRLRNEGPDAFRPDLYSDRIIVRRTIPKVGGSTYALLSYDSKTKKEKVCIFFYKFVHMIVTCCIYHDITCIQSSYISLIPYPSTNQPAPTLYQPIR